MNKIKLQLEYKKKSILLNHAKKKLAKYQKVNGIVNNAISQDDIEQLEVDISTLELELQILEHEIKDADQ